jgi:hypothetical protein
MPSSHLHRITTLRPHAHGTPLAAIALAGLALVVAGCGSSSPTTSTASADPGGSRPQNMVSDAFKFATCMRNHGVTNFPDPQVSSTPTSTSIRMMAPTGLKSSPAGQAALHACRGILPMPKGGGQQVRSGPPVQAIVELARCLRSHGYPRFPDPSPQGQLSPQMISSAGIDMQAPGFLHTAENCAGATHGQITAAEVAQAVNHAESGQ